MKITAIGMGDTDKIDAAYCEVVRWLNKNAKKLKPAKGNDWWHMQPYEVVFEHMGLKGHPVRVECYSDRYGSRGGFSEITLIGNDKKTLQAWRKIFRRMGGYKT